MVGACSEKRLRCLPTADPEMPITSLAHAISVVAIDDIPDGLVPQFEDVLQESTRPDQLARIVSATSTDLRQATQSMNASALAHFFKDVVATLVRFPLAGEVAGGRSRSWGGLQMTSVPKAMFWYAPPPSASSGCENIDHALNHVPASCHTAWLFIYTDQGASPAQAEAGPRCGYLFSTSLRA